jgi:hypothetical protein
MGLFKRFNRGKKPVSRSEFPQLIDRLNRELRAQREQWWFANLSTLKSEGIEYTGISWILADGSTLDSALKGFQLTCVLGFASTQKYFAIEDFLEFERQLKEAVSPNDLDLTTLDLTTKYNERYLDCAGDVDCLADLLINDVIELIGDSGSPPRVRSGFKASVSPFAITGQAVTAATFGDHQTEKKLKSLLKIV